MMWETIAKMLKEKCRHVNLSFYDDEEICRVWCHSKGDDGPVTFYVGKTPEEAVELAAKALGVG